MNVNLLPDLERRQLEAAQVTQKPTYIVMEYSGYYARVAFFAGLGELFSLVPSEDPNSGYSVAGVVTDNAKDINVSLLMLYQPLDPEKAPFVATRLDTEFFNVESIKQ